MALSTIGRTALGREALGLSGVTRTVTMTAALSGPVVRPVIETAALLATVSRTVPDTAALLATSTRTVTENTALQATVTRTVSQTAALVHTYSRPIPQTAAILQTSIRVVRNSAELVHPTSTREVPMLASISAPPPPEVIRNTGKGLALHYSTVAYTNPNPVVILNDTTFLPARIATVIPPLMGRWPRGEELIFAFGNLDSATQALFESLNGNSGTIVYYDGTRFVRCNGVFDFSGTTLVMTLAEVAVIN